MNRLLSHRLRWAVAYAVAAAVLALWAFLLDPGGWRTVVGGLAVLLALAYVVAWVRAPDSDGGGKIAGWGTRVLLSVLAFGAAIVGIAVVLGRVLANSIEPLQEWVLILGAAALGLSVAALIYWWAQTFQRELTQSAPRRWISLFVALIALGAWLVLLDQREVPAELDSDQRRQARLAGAGLYDLLLVVDPADPVSRALVTSARRDAEARRDAAGNRAPRLFTQPSRRVPYNLAYGLAVPEAKRGNGPLWRLVEPPTTDARELVASLAAIPLRDGPPASGSYGRLLADVLVDERVTWRDDAQRGIAFALDELPSPAELDSEVSEAAPVMPATDSPEEACSRLADHRPAAASPNRAVAVAWGDALALHCERREKYRSWEQHGRRFGEQPRPPVAMYAVSGEAREERKNSWWTWVRALDGRFYRPPTSGERVTVKALLADARDIHLGVPVGELKRLTRIFRPHLYFDASEKFFPVDVDWLIGGDQPSRVCDHDSGHDNCEDVRRSQDLIGPFDEYLDLVGGARLGSDVAQRDGGPARMYVHVRDHEGKLYLGYWWFTRFNTSPWQTELNCLPGLTLAGLSCHDHEGDWEGVTVILDVLNEELRPDPHLLANVTPEAVVYEAHAHRIRWNWDDVNLAADPRSYATHPVVYSAAGSHASYPAGCREDCDQQLSDERYGEGTFDGGTEWRYNARDRCKKGQEVDEVRYRPCLVGLPSTRDGLLGVLWNAFPGAWGAALCTPIAKVCSMVDGPQSPSRQGRFKTPWQVKDGDADVLENFREEYGEPVSDDPHRWPPAPWPRSAEPRPGEPVRLGAW